ncbi:MAG: hypothetical protein GY805_35100 [Chloroflexi bacterium]|nr:hypothetical protein [Chloroflexota bacterium]
MSKTNWYPEQIYRAAHIIAMLVDGYTWEDVEAYANKDYSEVWDIWCHYRRTRLSPYMALSPMHREIVKIRGQGRLAYYEELSPYSLNQPQRKMVVFPNGVYTITYKRRSCKTGKGAGQLEGSLQKSRSINGCSVMRAVSLGRVGDITKERLLASSRQLKRKLERLRIVQ